jgi:hypothetical protein
MKAAERSIEPFVMERAPKPTDVFLTEQSIAPFGPKHRPGELPSDAAARIAYQKFVGKDADAETVRALGLALRVGGAVAAGLACAAWASGHRRLVRRGVWFGVATWVAVDELALPLLGLADKPTAYHPTHHLQTLVERVAFGIAAAATTRLLEGFR